MGLNKWFLIGLVTILIGLLFFTLLNKKQPQQPPPLKKISEDGRTKVKYPEDHTIVLVGDSMTEYLGNSDELRAYLKEHYPGKTFEVLNYGFGSTNILSVEKRLTENTYLTREYRPILNIDFDVILIESFGHNPLSDYSLEEGLKKQAEALDKIVSLIKEGNPNSKIVFVATISPNSKTYAYRSVDLTDQQREIWVKERIAYIKNHIEYAKSHNIPIVNVFEESLDETGDGNRDYISDTDYIHPSPTGVVFISKQIADFIFEQKIL